MCLTISITVGEVEDEEQVESEEDEESPSDDEMDEAQQVSKAKSMAAALKSSKGAQCSSIMLPAAHGSCGCTCLF